MTVYDSGNHDMTANKSQNWPGSSRTILLWVQAPPILLYLDVSQLVWVVSWGQNIHNLPESRFTVIAKAIISCTWVFRKTRENIENCFQTYAPRKQMKVLCVSGDGKQLCLTQHSTLRLNLGQKGIKIPWHRLLRFCT